MDWKRFDGILDVVETALLALSSRFHIKEPQIERWRWDTPIVTLAWLGAEHIKRNVGVRAVSESEVAVEVNAWRDEDRDDGKVRVRHWEHSSLGHIKVSDFESVLARHLEQAYFQVNGWKSANLKKETFLQPATRV
jgi:hypothetical protein